MKRLTTICISLIVYALMAMGQVNNDGIEYEYFKDGRAQVKTVSTSLSGELKIPPTVSYKGRIYKVATIKSYAFQDCSQLTSVIVPSEVSYIGDYAFKNCTGLRSIKLPVKIDEIGGGAFYNCCSLISVELPTLNQAYAGFHKVNSELFYGCSSLIYVKIPSGATAVESSSFYGCTSLTDIFCYPTKVPYLAGNAFDKTNRRNIKVHAPNTVLSQYRSSNWNQFKSIDSDMTRPQIKKQSTNNVNINTRAAIDMGGTIEWANMNLESKDIRDVGGIFSWGETTSKTEFTPRNYNAPKFPGRAGYEIYEWGLKGTNYDAARTKWGDGWRLPTEKEFNELIYSCEQILHSKEKYVEFIAPNGNRMILPLLKFTNVTYDGIDNIYWTSDIDDRGAICIYFWEGGYMIGSGMITTISERKRTSYFKGKSTAGHYGGLIRPVRDKGRQARKDVQGTTSTIDIHKNSNEVDLKEKLIKDAKNGDSQAQKKLAQLYSSANEKDRDIDKAVSLYTALAIKGDKESQNALCQFRDNTLKSGVICKQLANDYMPYSSNPNEEWNALRCEAACKLGNIKAIKEMIERYKTGKGVKRDSDKEFYMMELGAKSDRELMYQVATTYLDQNKGHYNEQKGIEMLTNLADMGYDKACNLLGNFYKYGVHVTKDKKKAKIYLK